ncbi:GNAT family N-acetyltransferase [uncultured Psychroserpens sp.]|uniref:GNAT family N-acetyltransferase n=1 Tax=uncultured Psychroserpens sp. TaxID=255436 RepID=UPI0026195438|nr:GNAT family N-acetyltransferase [uncultured Psychroserpens sp.]
MTIIQATLSDLDALTELFDSYRVFYKQSSDLKHSKQFLKERMLKNDSIIYMTYLQNNAVGFTQLYPLLSSVSMQSMYLLNDLYVHQNYRKQGIGEALIDKAKQLCKNENNKGLAIQTAFDNPAQHLYQRLGFAKDTDLHFFWSNEFEN